MSGIIRDLFKITSPENEDPPPYWKRGIGLLLVMIFTTLVAIRRMLAMLLRYITRRRLGAHSESTVVAFFHPYWLVFPTQTKCCAFSSFGTSLLPTKCICLYSVIMQEEVKGCYGGQ